MADSDSEYEEEETLIAVELHGVIDSEIFTQDSFNRFKLLALDSESPILQVENFVFTGGYEHTMGTTVVFEEEEKRVKKCDPVFCKKPARMLKYVCKTNKTLSMKRVFVSEKTGEGNKSADNDKQSHEGDGPSTSKENTLVDKEKTNSIDKEKTTSVDMEINTCEDKENTISEQQEKE